MERDTENGTRKTERVNEKKRVSNTRKRVKGKKRKRRKRGWQIIHKQQKTTETQT